MEQKIDRRPGSRSTTSTGGKDMAGDGVEGTVLVSYAVGWDLVTRAALEPLTRAEAEARDGAGQEYVKVHRLPGRSEPLEVHLVAWGESYVGVWAYDEQGRRTGEADWRLLEPERVFLRHLAVWRYESPQQAEFAPEVGRTYWDLLPDGKGRKVVERPGGGSFHTLADIAQADRWRSRAGFGVRGVGGLLFPDAGNSPLRLVDVSPGEPGAPATTATASARWLPPRPGRQAYLKELFEPGTRFGTSFQPEMTVSDVRWLADLRLPSGRLVVDDPGNTGTAHGRELSERFPPGTYPLQATVVAYEYEFMGEHCAVEEPVAVRVLLGEEAPVSWELALAAGDDVRLLRDDGIFGFSTDGAAGSFADASGWEVLAERVRSYYQDSDGDAAEFIDDGHLRTTDEATGSDLVTFFTGGDGTYPVWLGRSDSGAPVCVVVQSDYLPELRLL
ncbi:DUF4241 domain-containing protein [Streptomyces sp. NEAU-NA10]|uniref:DUF4241 domain-containing protein n=1 Tax=Streptomyces sp. NEAU-NA10 TaxID=3416050 RepID=UPI003CC6A67A